MARAATSLSACAAGIVWIVAASSQTAARATDQAAPSIPGSTHVVCVGADNVLRAPRNGRCAAGETTLPIDGGVSGNPWSSNGAENPEPPGATVGALGDLDTRLKALEDGPLFEVIEGGSGRTIFDVRPGAAMLYAESGAAVAALRAPDDGGFLRLASAGGDLAVSIGASANVGGLRITEGGLLRLDYGKQPAGNMSLIIPGAGGQIAGIGESRAGTGGVIANDHLGRTRAQITIAESKGLFAIRNAAGAYVLSMTEGATGGGLLAIGDSASEPMVKLGVEGDRYGVALTGPVAGFPLVPATGLPGSYILGCAGGEACGPKKGGR